MTLRPLIAAFSLSLCFHASLGATFRGFEGGVENELSDSILISSVDLETEPPKPEKEIVVIKKQKQSKKLPASKPAKMKAAALNLPGPKVITGVKPTTSAELLSDPEKGKIFISYFAGVKDKIYRTLKQSYTSQAGGTGEVALYFVLNASGHLAKMAVIEKESDPDIVLRNLALDCLKSSAPFEPFAGDLKSEQIAFQVKIQFDEGI